MSRDQRPGKVRVVSQEAPSEPPKRRRGDGGDAAQEEENGAPAAGGGLPSVAMVMLFVMGSAIGGATIAVLGLFGVRAG